MSDHFEFGAGGQVLLIVPGAHLKLRYAPINLSRLKIIAEIRGEGYLAPLAGWNYNFKLGTTLKERVGLHVAVGRSHYVGGMRTDSTDDFNRIFQNTIEFGVCMNIRNSLCDFFIAAPLHVSYVPMVTLGVSWTFGNIWEFKERKARYTRPRRSFISLPDMKI